MRRAGWRAIAIVGLLGCSAELDEAPAGAADAGGDGARPDASVAVDAAEAPDAGGDAAARPDSGGAGDLDQGAPDAQIDPDPWPAAAPSASAAVSLVYAGEVIALGEALRLDAAPAGLDRVVDFELILTNRRAEPLELAAEGWLEGAGLSFAEPPPAHLAPGASARLRLRFASADFVEGQRIAGRLSVPAAGVERALDLLVDVPPPLRMVVVGAGNTTLISDSYGADFTVAPAIPGPSARETVTWGDGVFFRSWANGGEWADPGRYAYSFDGVEWFASAASDGFWASRCAFGLGQFTCAASNDLLWSQTGATVIREGQGWASMIHDFAFGGDRFVGVGRESRRVVSLDGRNWTIDRRDEADDYLNAVVYAGEGRWIGAGGRDRLYVIRSADGGETWDTWIDPEHRPGATLACGPTRCLLGTQGTPDDSLLASDDFGRTWVTLMTPAWTTYTLLGWVNGWFFATHNPHQAPAVLLRSRDGVEWTPVHTMDAPVHLRGMAVEGWTPPPPGGAVGTIVAAEAPAVDPTQMPATPPCAEPLEVRLADGPLGPALDLGETPAGGAALRVEVTLTNPCAVPLHFLGHPDDWLEGPGFELASLPPVALAPGASAPFTLRFSPAAGGVEAREALGRLTLPYDQPTGPLTLDLSARVGPPLRLVFVGDGGHRVTTGDYGASALLDTFATLQAHGDTLQRGVCWGRGRFVSVGGNVDRRWWTSADGVDWVAHQAAGGALADCAYGDGRFVTTDGQPLWSADGLAWVAGERGAFNQAHLRAITFGGGRFVAVGDAGRISVTADGTAWDHTVSLETDGAGFTAVAWGGGVFVAVGEAGWIAHSADGEIWQAQQVGDRRWGGIAWVDGRFVAGDGSQIVASADGAVWDPVNASPISPRVGVGRQIFGTRGREIHRSEDGGFSWTLMHTSPEGLGLGRAAAERSDRE